MADGGLTAGNTCFGNDDHAYETHIKKVMNGFIVTVGCKTLVFEDQHNMFDELNRYYNNHKEVEKEYLEKYRD